MNFSCLLKHFTYILYIEDTTINEKYDVKVSNSKDVEELLDQINWKIYVYRCFNDQACNHVVLKKMSNLCFNSSCCFSNNVEDIFSQFPHCNSLNCTNFQEYVQSSFLAKWFIFLVLGCVCLLGNSVVIKQKLACLWKKKYKHKEVQIYNALVLSLSLSDFLMGSYLVMIAAEIKHKSEKNLYFSNPGLCDGIGITHFISSQVSVTTLSIISFYRMVSIAHPYQRQYFRLVFMLLTITWVIWICFAIIIILPFDPFLSLFSYGLNRDQIFANRNIISFAEEIKLLEDFLKNLTRVPQNQEINSVLNAIIKFPSSAVLTKALEHFGWINLKEENWVRVGFFNFHYTCATNVLSTSKEITFLSYFNQGIVIYNLLASCFIVFSYATVATSVLRNGNRCRKSERSTGNQETQSIRNNENQTMFQRIAFVVISDLLCWLPVCFLSLVLWNPDMLPWKHNEYLEVVINVQSAMIFLVPINSIINPFTYSYPFWKRMLVRFMQLLMSLHR